MAKILGSTILGCVVLSYLQNTTKRERCKDMTKLYSTHYFKLHNARALNNIPMRGAQLYRQIILSTSIVYNEIVKKNLQAFADCCRCVSHSSVTGPQPGLIRGEQMCELG